MGTFLKTESSIAVNLLPTQENKSSFFASVCSKQTKFAVSFFRLQKANRSCSFSLVPFLVCGTSETWRHGDMETWKHADIDMETLKRGEKATWRHKDMEVCFTKKI